MRYRGRKPSARFGASDEPVSVYGEDGTADVRRTPDDEPGVGSEAAKGHSLRKPQPERGRFSLLLIDNETGKATRVNVYPLRLDTTLRSGQLDRRLGVGWVMMQMVEAAKRLWPEFMPDEEPPKLDGYPLLERHPDEGPSVPFTPIWRRWRWNMDDDEDHGGI
jgi:hypothetical protein